MVNVIKIKDLSSKIYFPDTTPNQIVIGVHGFFGDKESSVLVKLGETLVQHKIALLTFDLPCHGLNDNSQILSLSDCLNAYKDIFDWTKKEYPNIPISIFATSFGGYLTLLYLSTHDEKLNKIILRAPAINMHHVLEHVLLPYQSLNAEDLKTARNIGKEQALWVDYNFIEDLKNNKLQSKKPVDNLIYIFQGKKDDIVSPEDNEKFFQQYYKNKYKIIYFENADHRFKKPGELDRIISESINILL